MAAQQKPDYDQRSCSGEVARFVSYAPSPHQKTRHQILAAETGSRNGRFSPKFRTQGLVFTIIFEGRTFSGFSSSASAQYIPSRASALYGDRYAEFLDRVQAYAYFPYVVAKDVTDFRDGEISVRFEGISGRIDQGAGILFNLKPNGDYLTVRANPLENNLVLWKFEKASGPR